MHYPSLLVKGLSKQFNAKGAYAVSDLNFEIQSGECVAFLGPNGAGKSTTIKIICGILSPTQGKVWVDGAIAGTQQANRILGLVFGTRSQLYLHMTIAQCFDLIAEIYFVSGADKQARILFLTELFHVKDLLSRRVRTLSLGERMRCELIAALIHRPRILLADEPTIGLDVVVKNQFRELIRRWQQEEKTTLMLTSHDLSDVEALCSRCILIDKGVKYFDGSLDALKGELSCIRRIQVTTHSSWSTPQALDSRIRALSGESQEIQNYVHAYELSIREIPMAQALSILSAYYGDTLQDISISEVTLEEVLGHIYQKNQKSC